MVCLWLVHAMSESVEAVETKAAQDIMGAHLGMVEATLRHLLKKVRVKRRHLACVDVLSTGAVMKRTEVTVAARVVYIVETTWGESGATTKGWVP